jgi:carbohydrate-selective porin OprB
MLGLEMSYLLHLTPAASLQPALQVIGNPADSATDHSIVGQLQLNLNW